MVGLERATGEEGGLQWCPRPSEDGGRGGRALDEVASAEPIRARQGRSRLVKVAGQVRLAGGEAVIEDGRVLLGTVVFPQPAGSYGCGEGGGWEVGCSQ